MHDYLLTLLLGIVEGLTEFLPVSSTAHLRITQALLGISLEDPFWKMFAVVVQLGPILCLPLFFRERIRVWLKSFPGGVHGDRTAVTHPLTLTLVAFFFTAAPALILKKVISKHLEDLSLIAIALIAGGIVMWIVDSVFGRSAQPSERSAAEELEHMGLARAIWIGLCQCVSGVFPGTSRSMATIAGGEACGLTRTAALEFSFLLSIPTMVAATGHDFVDTLKGGAGAPPLHIGAHGLALILFGNVISFLIAYAVIGWFLNWVRTKGFAPFAIYRIVAGLAVLAWLFAGAK